MCCFDNLVTLHKIEKTSKMHFISPELEDYVEQHSENEPALLAALNKETYQKILLPRMLSGHFQGRVLSMLSKLIRPVNILEIGTYTGYSALCLCEGMQENGVLHTIDIKEELVDFQRKHFDKSPWGKQIVQHLGEAIEIIPTLDIKFDLVFIDADKENYLNYFELIVPRMNKGGIILSDNVLWSGKVLEPLNPKDISTKVLLEYNQLLKDDPRVETVLLPIRDGLTVSRVL
jgi:caffeoyl-CoA O-methyltransferase